MTGAERLLAQLGDHRPSTPREATSLAQIRRLLRWLPAPFDEAADPTHVTASAVVTDGSDHVVLHRHRRLGLWLQPGGHLEPGEEPEVAAIREVREETGLDTDLHRAAPTPLHVDVHEGGRGHLHLDLRYLLIAPPGAPLRPPPEESQEVAWLTWQQALELGDESLRGALAAARSALGLTTSPHGPR